MLTCKHCCDLLDAQAEVRLGDLRWHLRCWVPWLTDRLQEASVEAPNGEADAPEGQLSENEKLRNALHAAIARPKGVVPAEAEEFYDPRHPIFAHTPTTAPKDAL